MFIKENLKLFYARAMIIIAMTRNTRAINMTQNLFLIAIFANTNSDIY